MKSATDYGKLIRTITSCTESNQSKGSNEFLSFRSDEQSGEKRLSKEETHNLLLLKNNQLHQQYYSTLRNRSQICTFTEFKYLQIYLTNFKFLFLFKGFLYFRFAEDNSHFKSFKPFSGNHINRSQSLSRSINNLGQMSSGLNRKY